MGGVSLWLTGSFSRCSITTLGENPASRQWYAYLKGYRSFPGPGLQLQQVCEGGIRGSDGISVELKKNDRRGAQLSQECPLPINHQPMGTNNRKAQCRWMRSLVPIGLGYRISAGRRQIVSCQGSFFWGGLSIDSRRA